MKVSIILGLYIVHPVNVEDLLWLICVSCFVVLGCSWWIGWQSSKDSCISSGLFWVWWLICLFSALFKSVTKCNFFICMNWQVRLRDHGVLDFDASDLRRQPPVDTTWQQVYFACLICIKHRIKIVADIVFFLSSNGNIKTHESKLNRLNGKLPLE